jgi:VCBS repeat-containing protein
MPRTTNNVAWDFAPADTITLSAAFTFDLQDPSDSQTVANVLTTVQGRTPSVTITQTDNATLTVTVTI